MINFGAVTVTHDGTSLGKTFGGGSIELTTLSKTFFNSTYGRTRKDYVVAAFCVLNLYNWSSTITISSDTDLLDYAVVVLENSKIKITLHRCKIMLDNSFGEVGTNKQKPLKIALFATRNGSGNVITIEEGS